jgi:hypothetical protein
MQISPFPSVDRFLKHNCTFIAITRKAKKAPAEADA